MDKCNMDDLVDSSSIHSRELIQDTFNPFLVHALIVHGFGECQIKE